MSQSFEANTVHVQMTVSPTTITTVLDPDSYDKGYDAGEKEGHQAGKTEGYAEGHQAGKTEGYTEGYTEGEQNGHMDGYTDGYQVGMADGYQAGKTEGYTEGHQAGKTEGYTEGHDAGKKVGKQEEYDAFWDAYQWSGQRWNYSYAFAYDAWTDETFNPKYPIGTGWDLNLNSTFSDAKRITRIPLIKPANWTNFTDSFKNCTSLIEVRFEDAPGKISNNISFADSPLLSRESVESVVACLSDTTTGKTVTFHSTAKANAFPDEEWSALIATKPNWTFSLI